VGIAYWLQEKKDGPDQNIDAYSVYWKLLMVKQRNSGRTLAFGLQFDEAQALPVHFLAEIAS
jgi:hypothetical protein